MSSRIRLSLWALAVAGCGLSPALFRLVAPWAGASWQCVCLGGILWLYATTPADAIRLPKWVSKAVIVGGMAAWPWLCYGRVTWALVVAPVVVFVFDHLPLTISRPEEKRSVHVAARWSWYPGIASDWLATIMLWSPVMWMSLAGRTPAENPESAAVGTMLAVGWMFVLQLPDRGPAPSWLPQRVGVACVFLAINLGTIVGYAMYGDR